MTPDRPDETLAPLLSGLTQQELDNILTFGKGEQMKLEILMQRRLSAEKDAKLTQQQAVYELELTRYSSRLIEQSATLARLEQERDMWERTAREMGGNREYYRALVIRCGEALGPDAKLCDDGTVAPDVLCAKVPELVEAREQEIATLKAERDNYSSRLLDYVDALAASEQRIARLTEALTSRDLAFALAQARHGYPQISNRKMADGLIAPLIREVEKLLALAPDPTTETT